MVRFNLDNEVAPEGTFVLEGVFLCGKHCGETLDDVARKDPTYLCWVLEQRTCEMLALTQQETRAVQLALDAVAPPVPVPPSVPSAFLPPEFSSVPTVPEAPPVPVRDAFLQAAAKAADEISRASGIVWTDEQRQALDEIDSWYEGSESFFSLTGPAGTGKTTILKEIVNRFPTAACAAMTGKAALRMSECTHVAATTLHKILYYPPRGGANLRFTAMREPPSDLVIIDEASMMSPAVYADLNKWAAEGVRFLLVGDPFQLPPVISDKQERDRFGEDWSVFSQVPGVALRTVMRNAGGVLRAATFTRETNKLLRKSDLDAAGSGYEYLGVPDSVERAVADYCADPKDHILITWRNAVRMRANALIREQVKKDGPLPDEGEPVLLRKNGQGHLNGEVVTCGGFDVGPVVGGLETLLMRNAETGERLLVSVHGGNPEYGSEFFDGGFWVKDWGKYNTELERLGMPDPIPITWGYVLTAHAAQGSEARRVTVFLAPGDERSDHFKKPSTLPDGNKTTFAARFLYTSLTRGKVRSTMIVGKR